MYQITVGDVLIDVEHKNIKNLHLVVNPPDGRVRIAAPLRVDDEAVRLFAISRLAWIKKHRANFESQPRQSKREYLSGESHYFQGRRYLLDVVEHNAAPKVTIHNKTTIRLHIRAGSTQAQRETAILDWYRRQLKHDIPPLIKKWEKTIAVSVHDWGVKRMKTKWGTCNVQAKRIWLNLELAKKPKHCLEYIIVHEMVHFLVRHHDGQFIAYMDKFLPNWRSIRDELNQFPLESF